MNYEEQDDEREINLGNMFSFILRSWMPILVFSLIMAVVVGAYTSARQVKENSNYYGDNTAKSLKENLTATQINTIDQLFQRYTAYHNKSQNNQDYLDRSILMNLDPNNISNETIEYVVSSNQYNVVKSFSDLSLDQEDYKEIAAALSTNKYTADPKYAYELVDISSATDADTDTDTDDGDSLDVTTEGKGLLTSGGKVSKSFRNLMEVTITASSKEQCEAISEIVEKAIREHLDKLSDAGIQIDLKKTTDNYTESVDRDLADKQQDTIMNGSDLINQYNEFRTNNIDTLDEDEKNYFDYLVANRDKKARKVHWQRNAGIGGLAGFAVALVVVIIAYLCSKKFHTPDEVERTVRGQNCGNGVPTLGVYSHTKKKHIFLGKVFNGWADRIDYSGLADADIDEEVRSTFIAQRVRALCANSEVKKLYFLDNYTSEYGDRVREELISEFKNPETGKQDIEIGFGNPLRQPAEFASMSGSDAAILLQGIGDVRRTTLESLLQICGENSLPLIGTVIIAETE